MRFVLIAFALFGVALYIANPQNFGMGYGVNLSGGKPMSRVPPRLDLAKIGKFGADMFDVALVASNRLAESYAASGNQVYSALNQPPSYDEQLAAIAGALVATPEETAAHMYDSTKSCIEEEGAEAPPQMVNYFSGLVQVVALTNTLEDPLKGERFAILTTPLNDSLGAWLKFMPEEERSAHTAVLESWAARPKTLVACHLEWLEGDHL